MKKTTFLLIMAATLFVSPFSMSKALAQPSTQTDDLFLLAKVWGFLKYYHPAVASGRLDWDNELLRFLPVYRQLPDQKTKNDSLLAWINGLGDIEECPVCETAPPKNAKLAPDFSWMKDPRLSTPLQLKLKNIIRNRNTKPNTYVNCMAADGIQLPMFQNEKRYSAISYPDTSYGIICLFRFWNVIEYWYPYKYDLRLPWDDVLRKFIPRMAREENALQYGHDIEEMVSAIDDSHGYIVSPQDKEIHGQYMLPFTIKYVGKWVITSFLKDSLAKAAGLRPGDIVDSMNDRDINDIAHELSPYVPASNHASLMNKLSQKIIQTFSAREKLVITRDNKQLHVVVDNFKPWISGLVDGNPAYFSFQKDSTFCILPHDIGYVNMNKLERNDSVRFKQFIGQTRGLIIDDRQNADESRGTNATDILANMILPPNTNFVRFSSAVPSFPGVFLLTEPQNLGTIGSNAFYPGKIAVLINENSISVGEFITMAYKMAPHARLIGTPTAGADGNVTYLTLPGGTVVQFTSLGVYFPDGKETQRVGIQPDIIVQPSVEDYKQKKDVQLEKALLYLSYDPSFPS